MTNAAYRRSTDAAISEVGDRLVLYHRRSRSAVVLNPTGSRIWERLDTPRTIADLSGDLCRRFPALSADEAARDVSAFLDELTRHDMVAVG